jgi:N-acetylmuramoyl-L-alanine amidase
MPGADSPRPHAMFPVPVSVRRRSRVLLVALCVAGAACSSARGASPSATYARSSPSTAASRTPSPAPVLLVTPTGVTVAVLGRAGTGWSVETPCGRTAIVHGGRTVPRVQVMIDPGHGGGEAGAVAGDLLESQLNLQAARRLQHDLTARGISAALTRTGDYVLPIRRRVAFVDRVHPQLLISMHLNSGPAADHAGPGTEVYYQHTSAASKRLAGLVWQHLFTALDRYHVHWVGANYAGALDRLNTAGTDYYGMLRLPHVPAVLVEPVYMSEPSEGALLRTAGFRNTEAAAITNAVHAYLTSRAGGGRFTSYPPGDASAPFLGGNPPCIDPKLG